MKKYGCYPMHHGTKMCMFKKKPMEIKNVYGLLVSAWEEEEIPHPSPPPPLTTTTAMTLFKPSS